MTPQRLAAHESGLNGVARKVLDAVPVSEPWSKTAIHAEIRRTGTNVDGRIVDGCLETLRGRGLIREPERGLFIRVTAKPKVVRLERSQERTDETDETPTPAPKEDAMPAPQADPLEKMARLAESARKLATEIENVALEIEAQAEKVRQDTATLRQLQTLLKNLNTQA